MEQEAALRLSAQSWRNCRKSFTLVKRFHAAPCSFCRNRMALILISYYSPGIFRHGGA